RSRSGESSTSRAKLWRWSSARRLQVVHERVVRDERARRLAKQASNATPSALAARVGAGRARPRAIPSAERRAGAGAHELRNRFHARAMDFAAAADLSWKRVGEVVMAVVVTRLSTKAMTRWVVVLTGVGSLMAALDTLAVSTALSKIRLDLGASVEQLEWVVNAYNLSF